MQSSYASQSFSPQATGRGWSLPCLSLSIPCWPYGNAAGNTLSRDSVGPGAVVNQATTDVSSHTCNGSLPRQVSNVDTKSSRGSLDPAKQPDSRSTLEVSEHVHGKQSSVQEVSVFQQHQEEHVLSANNLDRLARQQYQQQQATRPGALGKNAVTRSQDVHQEGTHSGLIRRSDSATSGAGDVRRKHTFWKPRHHVHTNYHEPSAEIHVHNSTREVQSNQSVGMTGAERSLGGDVSTRGDNGKSLAYVTKDTANDNKSRPVASVIQCTAVTCPPAVPAVPIKPALGNAGTCQNVAASKQVSNEAQCDGDVATQHQKRGRLFWDRRYHKQSAQSTTASQEGAQGPQAGHVHHSTLPSLSSSNLESNVSRNTAAHMAKVRWRTPGSTATGKIHSESTTVVAQAGHTQELALYGRADHAQHDTPLTAWEAFRLCIRAMYLLVCFLPFISMGVPLLLVALYIYNSSTHAIQHGTAHEDVAVHGVHGSTGTSVSGNNVVDPRATFGVVCRTLAWRLLLLGCRSSGAGETFILNRCYWCRCWSFRVENLAYPCTIFSCLGWCICNTREMSQVCCSSFVVVCLAFA